MSVILPLFLVLLTSFGCHKHAVALKVEGGGWNLARYPNPTTPDGAELCGRSVEQSWICDPDGVINSESRDVVEGIIKNVREGAEPFIRLKCGSAGLLGDEIGVALMRSFSPQWPSDPARSAEALAKGLHDAWGVGKRECNNGALLLISTEDKQIFISTGTGTMRRLTDKAIDRILEGMKPRLRNSKYGEAVEHAVMHMGLALSGKMTGAVDDNEMSGWFSLLFFAIVGFFFAWAARRTWKQQTTYDDCMDKLKKLMRDQEQFQANGAFNASSCPICFDDFDAPVGGADRGSPEAGPSKAGAASTSSPSSEAGEGGATATPAAAGLKKPLVLPCGHAFCESCITEWIKQRKTSCPVCRKPLDESDPMDTPPPAPCSDGTATSAAAATAAAARAEGASSTTTEEDPAASHRRPGFSWASEPERRRRVNWRMGHRETLHAELLFRLMTLRRRYPTYINDQIYNGWEQDMSNGRPMSASLLRQFQDLNPRVRAEMAQAGRSGSGRSFGGGSSCGGGGRGGGW